MRARWLSTVRPDTNNCSPMTRLLQPSAASAAISRSRRVSRNGSSRSTSPGVRASAQRAIRPRARRAHSDARRSSPSRRDALLAATREALLNAVKHGGGAQVALFAKVREATATVFVRDRGPGFDPTTTDPQRRGLRVSILARMERVGGRGEILSSPGEGCEVILEVPL